VRGDRLVVPIAGAASVGGGALAPAGASGYGAGRGGMAAVGAGAGPASRGSSASVALEYSCRAPQPRQVIETMPLPGPAGWTTSKPAPQRSCWSRKRLSASSVSGWWLASTRDTVENLAHANPRWAFDLGGESIENVGRSCTCIGSRQRDSLGAVVRTTDREAMESNPSLESSSENPPEFERVADVLGPLERIVLAADQEIGTIQQRLRADAAESSARAETRVREAADEQRRRIAEIRQELTARASDLAMQFDAVLAVLDEADRTLAVQGTPQIQAPAPEVTVTMSELHAAAYQQPVEQAVPAPVAEQPPPMAEQPPAEAQPAIGQAPPAVAEQAPAGQPPSAAVPGAPLTPAEGLKPAKAKKKRFSGVRELMTKDLFGSSKKKQKKQKS